METQKDNSSPSGGAKRRARVACECGWKLLRAVPILVAKSQLEGHLIIGPLFGGTHDYGWMQEASA